MADIQHVLCTKPCPREDCERGMVPGGRYKSEGEIITCHTCEGTTEVQVKIPFDIFCALVLDRIEADAL